MISKKNEKKNTPPILVLSLFPGIDLLGRGFEEEGFSVVRGPDPIWGQKGIEEFHIPPGRFDGIIAGPPCKAFSRAVKGNTPLQKNLFPELRRVIKEGKPAWYLIENVTSVPDEEGIVEGYYTEIHILDASLSGSIQRRVRKFWFGAKERLSLEFPFELHPPARLPTVTAHEYKGYDKRKAGRVLGRRLAWKELKRAFDLPQDFELPFFTIAGKYEAVGNGVPLKMAREIAKAIKRAIRRRI